MPQRHPTRFALLLALIWAGALTLALAGLGNVPLRDWDEGIVARVALEGAAAGWPGNLLPSFWGEPYLNKPPGLHWLIALGFHLWWAGSGSEVGTLPPDSVVRVVPAVLSSLLVPLVGLIQLRLRPREPAAALGSALIALTLLPLARHGRLAMLDGTQLTAAATLWLGLLMASPRQGRAWLGGLVGGLAGSGLLLLKAPVLLPILAIGLVLRWLDRDLPRHSWAWLLMGLGLGLLPGLAWHGWHGMQRGDAALLMWGQQGLSRLTTTVEEHRGNPLLPVLEVLEGGWPWLPLWPIGLVRCWRERHLRSGRWCLGLTLAMTVIVLPIRTQLPWYSLLLWPPFCLVCGPSLALLARQPADAPAVLRRLPAVWMVLGALLLAGTLLAQLPGVVLPQEIGNLKALPLPAALGLLLAGLLLERAQLVKRRSGLALLVLGWWLSLLMLVRSPLWNWELNETWPVGPVVNLIKVDATASTPVYMVGDDAERPTLRWYSQRLVQRWPQGRTWLLPDHFILIGRDFTADDGVNSSGMLQIEGATCRLMASGEERWQRWQCQKSADDDS